MSKENPNDDVTTGESLLAKNDTSVAIRIRSTEGSPRKDESFTLGDDAMPRLETVAERRMRKYSHYVVYCTTFIMSIGFSIILTGVWPYLKQLDPKASKEYLGWVIAANPIGQMVFSPILGWWANRVGSTRIAFVVTIILSILGSIMYALLPLMKALSSYLIFVSRFIVGLSGANIAICRSYIVASTKLQERTSALASVAAAQAIGFILGPILQSAIGYAFKGDKMVEDEISAEISVAQFSNGIPWNMYSSVGYITAILSLINLTLYLPCIFKDTSFNVESQYIQEGRQTEAKPDFPAIISLFFFFFVTGFLFVLIESILVPLVIDMYAYDYKTAVIQVGIGLSVMGVIAFFTFIIIVYISGKLNNDRILFLLCGFIPMTFGVLINMPVGSNYPIIMNCTNRFDNESFLQYHEEIFGSNHSSANTTCNPLGCPYFQKWCYYTPIIEKPQLITAMIITVAGYAVAFSLAPPLLSKMIGPRPQGLWMGLFSTIGGFSRIMGPIFAVYIYVNLGPRWLFGLLFSFFFATCFMIGYFYKRLVPYPVEVG